MSQLAGALAIVSGLAPESRWSRIVGVITDPERLVVRSWTGAEGDYCEEKMAKQFQGCTRPTGTRNERLSWPNRS
jgi:alpha-L-rhamnosidase